MNANRSSGTPTPAALAPVTGYGAPKKETRTIAIPIHPDDYDVPVSLVHLPLGDGQYATICGPLANKTLTALLGTLRACKDVLVKKAEDYEI